MSKPTTTTGTDVRDKIESIQQRMADVSEQQALAALGVDTTPITKGAVTSRTFRFELTEPDERAASALTQTASSPA